MLLTSVLYLTYLLNLKSSLAIVNYDNTTDILEEIDQKQVDANFIQLSRVDKQIMSNPIYIGDVSVLVSNMSSLTTTTRIPQPIINIKPTVTPLYYIGADDASDMSRPDYDPDSCEQENYIKLFNNTCTPKWHGQIIAVNMLSNQSYNTYQTANALSLYISSITNVTSTLPGSAYTLPVKEINEIVSNLSDGNVIVNSKTSYIMAQQPNKGNMMVLGASFRRGMGGEMINTSNEVNVTKSFVTAAATVSKESLKDATYFNMLIIGKPTGYEHVDNSNNKKLVSSVIVTSLRKNTSVSNSIFISLYFHPLDEYKQNDTGKNLCSFYNTNTSKWDETGCSDAQYNQEYDRYECNCSHLTSFALIWLPESLSTQNATKTFDAQDIASLIFQFISIICFIAILIHATSLRIIKSRTGIEAHNLLPLISTATTTILFIFYIALSMTVYTQTLSPNESQCFLSSTILMFITYFFLILMFCIKTSVGYFYYLRFVRLFPRPSYRKLSILLITSFFIALLCVVIAIGLNTQSKYNIIRLYPYRLCWFTRNVLYYFLTIPIGLFLALNIIIIVFVSKSIIRYSHNATRFDQVNERLKQCVIVLLSSCVTQGIGWLVGPFISFLNPLAGNILGWIFIILNGLEGLWSILLYLLIRSQQKDKQKNNSTATELIRTSDGSSNKAKESNKNNE